MEGLHIFNFEILISEKISWTVHRMHTHMEMLLPTCRPHFQGKEGPAPHLREKGQRNQGLTAFFKASLPLPVNQIFPPQLTARVLRDKVKEKGLTDPWSPSHV